MKNKITAVIVTFERPKYLDRAIQSVLDQKTDGTIIKVHNDGSGKETDNVINKYIEAGAKLEHIRNESNIGSYANYMRAIKSVDTEYFSIIADDDYLCEGFYNKAISVLDRDESLIAAVFHSLFVDKEGEFVEAFSLDKSGEIKKLLSEELFNSWGFNNDCDINMNWTSMVFRRKASEFYSQINLEYRDRGHDIYFLTRLFARYPISTISLPGSYYTYSFDSVTSNFKPIDHAQQVLRLNRLVEILFDPEVNKATKEGVSKLLDKKLTNVVKRNYRTALMAAFKDLVNISCSRKSYADFENILQSFDDHSYKKTYSIFNYLYRSKLSRVAIRLLFSGLVTFSVNRRKKKSQQIRDSYFHEYF